MLIKSVFELNNILIEKYNATISSLEEVNSYEHYSLVGDQEHDYTTLFNVYKIYYPNAKQNPYDIIFLLVFSQKDSILDIMALGEEPPEMSDIWGKILWAKD